MKDPWIARPIGGQIIRSLRSDADDKVHAVRIMLEKFVAALGLEVWRPKSLCLKRVDREWINFGSGKTSCAECTGFLAPHRFRMASAIMLQAELSRQINKI
jgi:hypothetical protein